MGPRLFLAVTLLLGLALACAGPGEGRPAGSGNAAAPASTSGVGGPGAPAPTSSPLGRASGVQPTAAPSATAVPATTQAGPPQALATTPVPLAGVRASISASCSSGPASSEVTVRYSLAVMGEGRLTRVRLLDNGQVIDDSGPVLETAVQRQKTLSVARGSQHSFQVTYEPPSLSPANARSSVIC